MSDYYSYKKKVYTCGNCKWEGLGSKTTFYEGFEDCMEIACPKCKQKIDVISFPSEEDVLKYGSKEDKAGVLKRRTFLTRLNDSYLKNVSQLPDLDGENIIFTTVETEENEHTYIVVSCEGKQIWKEMCGYEYYKRFICMGEILKNKYGNRMVDLVPPESVWLYGDQIISVSTVENFRKSLRPEKSVKAANIPETSAIELLDEKWPDGSRLGMSASLNEGELAIEGHDFGAITKNVGGGGEYEYCYKVAASHFPRLIKLLGGRPGDDILALLKKKWTGEKSKGLGELITKGGIPHNLNTYAPSNIGESARVLPPPSDFDKGLAFYRDGKPKEAIACFKKVLRGNPKDKEVLNLLGQALSADGQHFKAVASLRKALKIDQNYAMGYYDLATILAKKDNHKEALVYFEKYLLLRSADDEYMLAWALYAVACLHALNGHTEKALCFLEQSLEKGFKERKHIEKDSDLIGLRRDPRFIKLMKRHFKETK